MKIEDTAPAEFLLGKLANGVISTADTSKFDFKYKRSNNFRLLFFKIIYLFYIFLSIKLIQYCLTTSNYSYLAIIFTASILLSISKIKLLTKMYAPDLYQDRIYNFWFILVQYLLVYSLTGASILVLFSLLVIMSNFTINLTIYIIIAIYISIIYTYTISDIVTISNGLGMSIISNTSSLSKIKQNYYDFVKLRNSKSLKLSVFRIFAWTSFYYLILNSSQYYFFLLSGLLYIAITNDMEKSNASSLMMNIRGKIQELTPAPIPTKLLLVEIDDDSQIKKTGSVFRDYTSPNVPENIFDSSANLQSNFSLADRMSSDITFQKPVTNSLPDNFIELQDSESLRPYASRTINKIIESVKDDGIQYPNRGRRECLNCHSMITSESNFCHNCGESINLFDM